MNKYRIGEFANMLGVTPDFLKYYEKEKLLLPEKDPKSGYRFYRFHQTATLMQHIRDRNLGFSIKESQQVSADISFEQYMEILRAKKQLLAQSISRKELLLQYISRMEQLEKWLQTPGSWYIEDVPPFWLLPHSQNDHFFPDSELKKAAGIWYGHTPVTKSCCIYSADCFRNNNKKIFCLAATENAVQTLHLPLPPQAWKQPSTRCLILPLHEDFSWSDQVPQPEHYLSPVKHLLEKYHFELTGDFYRVMYAVFDRTDKRRESWHIFYIPIAV